MPTRFETKMSAKAGLEFSSAPSFYFSLISPSLLPSLNLLAKKRARMARARKILSWVHRPDSHDRADLTSWSSVIMAWASGTRLFSDCSASSIMSSCRVSLSAGPVFFIWPQGMLMLAFSIPAFCYCLCKHQHVLFLYCLEIADSCSFFARVLQIICMLIGVQRWCHP